MLIEKLEDIDDYTVAIKWKNYHSKEIAQSLHNTELFLDDSLAENHFDLEEQDDLMGYEVFNHETLLGVVSTIYENNFQETMEILQSDNKKLLVPILDEFIETIDDDKRAIYCLLSAEYIELFTT